MEEKLIDLKDSIESLRKYHQLDIYTVDEIWCIQLFDLNVATNDLDASCVYEDSNKSLNSLLVEALEWVNRNIESH